MRLRRFSQRQPRFGRPWPRRQHTETFRRRSLLGIAVADKATPVLAELWPLRIRAEIGEVQHPGLGASQSVGGQQVASRNADSQPFRPSICLPPTCSSAKSKSACSSAPVNARLHGRTRLSATCAAEFTSVITCTGCVPNRFARSPGQPQPG
jgi:hypothetical protein